MGCLKDFVQGGLPPLPARNVWTKENEWLFPPPAVQGIADRGGSDRVFWLAGLSVDSRNGTCAIHSDPAAHRKQAEARMPSPWEWQGNERFAHRFRLHQAPVCGAGFFEDRRHSSDRHPIAPGCSTRRAVQSVPSTGTGRETKNTPHSEFQSPCSPIVLVLVDKISPGSSRSHSAFSQAMGWFSTGGGIRAGSSADPIPEAPHGHAIVRIRSSRLLVAGKPGCYPRGVLMEGGWQA